MQPPLVRSPEFPPSLVWLNTSRPLSIASDLRGRVVVLDFWTSCCINCMHVVPVLRRLEERFAEDPLVVVGIHCGKFPSEQEPANVRCAVSRLDIAHPVAMDAQFKTWEAFAVRAWPTLVLIDAAGYVRETLSGEADFDALSEEVTALLAEGREKNQLRGDLPFFGERQEETASMLRFPGRIHCLNDRLIIADTGHHRLLVSDPSGRLLATIGSGTSGARDGAAESASFSNPQGLAVSGGLLFVADTGNHLLRCVDPSTWEVSTVAGTGIQGRHPVRVDPARPQETALRSPWGLLGVGGQILIAMAGSHQIWIFDTARRLLAPWAGSGREDHIDGALHEAAFAQPSGLAQAGRMILVADSEVSSVRAIDMLEGRVRTIIGRGLFDFGDTVGRPEEVLLQHPLDLAAAPQALYVADTYNNKIKEIRFGTMETKTVLGDGSPAVLNEPGGVTLAGARLLIADTNNHRILSADPASGEVEEIPIRA
jgi:thiol-disulfide isomerase/thioredoxin